MVTASAICAASSGVPSSRMIVPAPNEAACLAHPNASNPRFSRPDSSSASYPLVIFSERLILRTGRYMAILAAKSQGGLGNDMSICRGGLSQTRRRAPASEAGDDFHGEVNAAGDPEGWNGRLRRKRYHLRRHLLCCQKQLFRTRQIGLLRLSRF